MTEMPKAWRIFIGYSVSGDERVHDLLIGMLPDTKWRYVSMPRGKRLNSSIRIVVSPMEM